MATPGRLAHTLTRPRLSWALVVVPLLLGLALIGMVQPAEHDQQVVDELPAGLESTQAHELAAELPESDTSVAIVLWSSSDGELPDRALADLRKDHPDLQVAQDGTAAMAVVPIEVNDAYERIEAIDDLRDEVKQAAPDGVEATVTGPAAIQADFGQVFKGADVRLLVVTAVVVAFLLVITYRSPVLWIVPLVVVAVADRTAAILATHLLDALDMAWNQSTVGILSVLVFGAGTNYALLLISRYRDELRRTESRHDAMAAAYGPTAHAVFASASTVVIGLLCLLLSLVPNTRGLGLACALGVLVAAGFVMLVLPAAMLLFGRQLFWPLVPRVGSQLLADSERSLWSRIGAAVSRHPLRFAVGALLVLGVLAAGLPQVETGLRPAQQFLDTPESVSAAERLAESFPAGLVDPVTVVTSAPPEPVLAQVKDVEGIESARIALEGNGVARIEASTVDAPGSDAAEETVHRLRAELTEFPETYVGGGTAERIDEHAGAARDQRVIMPLILGLVVVALVLLLRSLVAPLILVSTVLATFAASMGGSWWVFTQVLGFEALATAVPLLAFLFLVALGVDYNIFLVTRALEESRTVDTRRAILRALTSTGGVITSAGILLAAVFAVLGVLPLVLLAQFGVVVCLGVLLDTLLVRTVLVPALVVLLGDRFWWPRRASVIAQQGS
jgi:RND superfamily putative drug exporter